MKQILLMIAVVALVGCGGNPNKKANELFVEAVQLIASAEKQTGEAAIKDYEQALGKLEEIIANYSESDLAVKLISGETLFTGKSLKEIKERVVELKRVAGAVSLQKRFLAGELTKADMEKVTSLKVGPNQLTDVKGLEKLTQLTVLYLFRNQLTDVKGLENLMKLESLYFWNNKLTSVEGLEKLTKLRALGLNESQLTELPKGLENLTQLLELNLADNQLAEVPKGLEKLTQLTLLLLNTNPDLTKAQISELQKALPKCRIFPKK